MRVGAAALSGGIFGVIGTLCFFLAFGTDYWLVASDNCGPYRWQTQTTPMGDKDANRTEVGQIEVRFLTYCKQSLITSIKTHQFNNSNRKYYF